MLIGCKKIYEDRISGAKAARPGLEPLFMSQPCALTPWMSDWGRLVVRCMVEQCHSRKLLIMGMPGAGKTTLARILAQRLNAVLFNADEVREHVNRDLGFTLPDRIEHARRMGWLCDRVTQTGNYAIADFICPTEETRAAFCEGGKPFIVWLDRIEAGRFEDTNQMFRPPSRYDVRVTAENAPEYWAEAVARQVRPVFDPKKPTALFIGRYQPFHDGHRRLIGEGLRRVGQACIAVRDVEGTDAKNPFPFEYVRSRIEHALREHEGRFIVVPVPNISHVFYGRDVGYAVERIELDAETEAISATQVRDKLGIVAGAYSS